MVLGRITHYAVDLVMASVVLAGVKRTTGFGCGDLLLEQSRLHKSEVRLIHRACHRRVSPQAVGLPEGTPTSIADSYLRVGERIFDYTCGLSYGSSYFTREGKSHNK